MPVQLRVRISKSRSPEAASAALSPEARVCPCGASEALGAWDPKRSTSLRLCGPAEADGSSVWEGALPDSAAVPGTEFKYVVFVPSTHQYVWENKGPMHVMPRAEDPVATHEFENGDGDQRPAQKRPSEPPAPQRHDAAGLVERHLRLTIADRLCIPTEPVVVAVCGEAPELGRWRVDSAPCMRQVAAEGGQRTLEADIRARDGAQFKYVLINSPNGRGPCWEESRPNRRFGAGPAGAAAPHRFDHMEPFEDSSSTAPPSSASTASAAAPPAARAAGGVPRHSAPAAAAKADVDLGDSYTDVWIPWNCDRAASPAPSSAPRSILHAFHWPFSLVREKLKDIHEAGFDAVQISPAQKSKGGKEWWARYQPQDYTKIEGLGSVEELRSLCAEAKNFGIMIIADVVFNHMIVVATAHEWERAQSRPKELEQLKQRLSQAVGPALNAEDFQWPWFKMSGPHWDDEMRYEGWGNGEWSELRHCPKVVDVHCRHLRDLVDAGVRGIRFDAIKHMRPEHVAEYVNFLRSREDGSSIYVYGEVLSVDEDMHEEYIKPLGIATTDFGLSVYVKAVLDGSLGPSTASAGARAAALQAASLDGVPIAGGAAPSSPTAAAGRPPAPPVLSSDSVRFARNHDTVMNPGSFYGLRASCRSARVVWAWALAVHDGSVLVYSEDTVDRESAPLVRRAVLFRRRTGEFGAASSEVCVRYARGSPTPTMLAITLRDSQGGVVGLCLVNFLAEASLTVRTVPVQDSSGGGAAGAVELVAVRLPEADEKEDVVLLQPTGGLADRAGQPRTVSVPPWDASFFVVRR